VILRYLQVTSRSTFSMNGNDIIKTESIACNCFIPHIIVPIASIVGWRLQPCSSRRLNQSCQQGDGMWYQKSNIPLQAGVHLKSLGLLILSRVLSPKSLVRGFWLVTTMRSHTKVKYLVCSSA